MADLTRKKAKKILKEGEIGGRKLTSKQRGFFGARAGGATIPREVSKVLSPSERRASRKRRKRLSVALGRGDEKTAGKILNTGRKALKKALNR